MSNDRLTEFITVLIFAMVVGAATMASILYLEGNTRAVVLIAVIGVTVAVWQYLRKRFGRQ